SGPARQARDGSSHHARRRVRAVADGQPALESTLLEADQGVRAGDRRADAPQYLVQRERADRAAPAGSARLFSADAHGRHRDGIACARTRRGDDMKLAGKRIMVTGAGGFLGRHVRSELERRGAATLFMPRKAEFDLTREADVREAYGIGRPQVVIHLAAVVGGIGANRESPGRFFYENVMMGA